MLFEMFKLMTFAVDETLQLLQSRQCTLSTVRTVPNDKNCYCSEGAVTVTRNYYCGQIDNYSSVRNCYLCQELLLVTGTLLVSGIFTSVRNYY